jgi:hypothetical protein
MFSQKRTNILTKLTNLRASSREKTHDSYFVNPGRAIIFEHVQQTLEPIVQPTDSHHSPTRVKSESSAAGKTGKWAWHSLTLPVSVYHDSLEFKVVLLYFRSVGGRLSTKKQTIVPDFSKKGAPSGTTNDLSHRSRSTTRQYA